MHFKQIITPGISMYSYVVGDSGEAVVIDPRRDVQVYLTFAQENNLKIAGIFETHRHEDFILGSVELSDLTGAPIYISQYEDLGYEYGTPIADGQTFQVGTLTVEALHTPGHTLGHLSYVVREEDRDYPYMVFSGDSLFFGDLGRTDFYGKDNLEKMTGLLYDSLFEKILPLGEGALLFPAHGPGSPCGQTMESRPYSTIGYEFATNPHLQVSSKEEFIDSFASVRIKNRYFDKMEVCNVKGCTFVGLEPGLNALRPDQVPEGAVILDLRDWEDSRLSFIPGTQLLPEETIASYLGVLFDTKQEVVLMDESDDPDLLAEAYWSCRRIGFDNIAGHILGGFESMKEAVDEIVEINGIPEEDIPETLRDSMMLEVRMPFEYEEVERDSDFMNIPLQVLFRDWDHLPQDKLIYTRCESGNRATVAASYLVNKGLDVCVVLNGDEHE